MIDTLFEDCVAIDTNVFEHLTNPCENTGSHIEYLLRYLQEKEVALIVDNKNRMASEYRNRMVPIIKRIDDKGYQIVSLLRYFLVEATRHQVPLDMGDRLMVAILQVIVEPSKSKDRIFVYSAFKVGKTLISNDEKDIVIGPVREGGQSPRRTRLLNSTKRLRPNGADILTSKEAYKMISQCPRQP